MFKRFGVLCVWLFGNVVIGATAFYWFSLPTSVLVALVLACFWAYAIANLVD